MGKTTRLFLYVFIIAGCLIMMYPLIWMFVSSFKENTEIFINTSLIPHKITFDNYKQGWAGLSGYNFGRFFLNTFFLVAMCIVGTLASCSMAAYAFARLNFFMSKVFFAIMLMTLMWFGRLLNRTIVWPAAPLLTEYRWATRSSRRLRLNIEMI